MHLCCSWYRQQPFTLTGIRKMCFKKQVFETVYKYLTETYAILHEYKQKNQL
jgi:hypothetical protein